MGFEWMDNKERPNKSETPPPRTPRSEQTNRALGKTALDATKKK